jgi:hypothetical protein
MYAHRRADVPISHVSVRYKRGIDAAHLVCVRRDQRKWLKTR